MSVLLYTYVKLFTILSMSLSSFVIMRLLCVFAVILIFVECANSQLKQERATINHCNPTYAKECYAITRRVRRGEPYKTNVTITSRYSSGNNVTFKVVLMSGLAIELLKIRACDFHSIDWFSEFLNRYSNINGTCPYKAGKYELYNVELPPKNLPKRILNLLKGKFYTKFYLVATETEELILESTILFQA